MNATIQIMNVFVVKTMKNKYQVLQVEDFGTGAMRVHVVQWAKNDLQFVCECGEWSNKAAQKNARLICKTLNKIGL